MGEIGTMQKTEPAAIDFYSVVSLQFFLLLLRALPGPNLLHLCWYVCHAVAVSMHIVQRVCECMCILFVLGGEGLKLA